MSKKRARVSGQETENGELLREQIACRAYELYEARGGEDGFDLQDWLQAEQEVLSQQSDESFAVEREESADQAEIAAKAAN